MTCFMLQSQGSVSLFSDNVSVTRDANFGTCVRMFHCLFQGTNLAFNIRTVENHERLKSKSSLPSRLQSMYLYEYKFMAIGIIRHTVQHNPMNCNQLPHTLNMVDSSSALT